MTFGRGEFGPSYDLENVFGAFGSWLMGGIRRYVEGCYLA